MTKNYGTPEYFNFILSFFCIVFLGKYLCVNIAKLQNNLVLKFSGWQRSDSLKNFWYWPKFLVPLTKAYTTIKIASIPTVLFHFHRISEKLFLPPSLAKTMIECHPRRIFGLKTCGEVSLENLKSYPESHS